jgi:ubiquinone/menaquinone biosynthesis C-methylase UbiE
MSTHASPPPRTTTGGIATYVGSHRTSSTPGSPSIREYWTLAAALGERDKLRRPRSVVGVDVSPEALTYVRARRQQMLPVRASVEALPFVSGAFDIALVVTVLYTVTDDAMALRELARVVRSGGAVLVVACVRVT